MLLLSNGAIIVIASLHSLRVGLRGSKTGFQHAYEPRKEPAFFRVQGSQGV